MPQKCHSRHITLWAVVIFLVLLGVRFTKPFDTSLSWDTKGYYLYLPARFIYHDPQIKQIEWVSAIQEQYQTTATLYMLHPARDNAHIIKYSMGMAYLYAPFFFTAHGFALISEKWTADGFSLPYQIVISLGMYVYILIGLMFMFKVLCRLFERNTAMVTMLILLSGTNLFNQFAFNALLSHAPLFVLYSILIWFIIQFYSAVNKAFHTGSGGMKVYNGNRQTLATILIRGAGLGLLCGLISLIRPTEAVCLLLFVFWGVRSGQDVYERWRLFLRNPLITIVFSLGFLLIWAPQFLYWKSLTGHWLHYSYNNPGEGLDFFSPHTLPFLFSFRKGWLIYTPLMGFALIGLWLMKRRLPGLIFPIGVFFILSLYLTSSWTTWWYAGGCFSSRAIVSVYPALAIALGCFIERVLHSHWRFRAPLMLIAAFLIFLNLFQTWQLQKGIITTETMTRAYYFRTFLKTSVDNQDRELLMVQRPYTTVEHFVNHSGYQASVLFSEVYSSDSLCLGMALHGGHQFSPVIAAPYHELTQKDHAWLRARARFYIPENYSGPDPLLVITFRHRGKNYKYRSTESHNLSLKKGWNSISMDYITPEVRSKKDKLQAYVWHRGQDTLYLESIEVLLYQPHK